MTDFHGRGGFLARRVTTPVGWKRRILRMRPMASGTTLVEGRNPRRHAGNRLQHR
jgi:hypothetical protein